jgi:hypothetical protein
VLKFSRRGSRLLRPTHFKTAVAGLRNALIAGTIVTAQTVSKPKPKPKATVRHVSPLIARMSYRWATEIYNIEALNFEDENDEMARTRMSAVRDQLEEGTDLDLCKKTVACSDNDAALVDMVVKAAALVMKERNELSRSILESQTRHSDKASTADYNLKLTHMHDADGCIKAIKSVAGLGVITSNDTARCDVPHDSATPEN